MSKTDTLRKHAMFILWLGGPPWHPAMDPLGCAHPGLKVWEQTIKIPFHSNTPWFNDLGIVVVSLVAAPQDAGGFLFHSCI